MFLKKIRVILWKNWLIRKRHWVWSICEALIPVLLFSLVAYGRSQITGLSKIEIENPTYNEQVNGYIMLGRLTHDSNFYYSPDTKFIQDLMHEFRKRLELPFDKTKGFPNEKELLSYYRTQSNKDRATYAIVFNPTESMTKQLEYSIRTFEKDFHWPITKLFSMENYYIPDIGSEHYRLHGFMALQWAIDESFMHMIKHKDSNVTITMQEFPYPPYIQDQGINDLFQYYLPLVTLLSFQLLCPVVLKRVVEEKSTGIKQLMNIMGLKQWMLWLGWFLHAIMVNIISIVIITVLMKITMGAEYAPIEFTDGSIIFTFLLLYCIACICFCFTLSTFFNNPSVAIVCGMIIWLLTYFIPQNYVLDLEKSTLFDCVCKMLLALLPNVSLGMGFSIISQYETREIGAQWNNIFHAASGGTYEITLFQIFSILIIQILLYTMITFYVDSIYPGQYGIGKRWYYPFKKIGNILPRKSVSPSHTVDFNNTDYIEPVTGESGIKIEDICKKYHNKEVLKYIDLNLEKNQINVLLGHNGAGKTTLMSIITGMIPATSGHIYIENYDISEDKDVINDIVGICPQHNMYFPILTVIEHLIFFARLKGMPMDQAKRVSIELLSKMNLKSHMDVFPDKLSGGMKRKLNLAIALVGDPKVLILDEPTSGMDFDSRREIWDILQAVRKHKTILLSTHFMEEADSIGGRIAIMDHGNLICYGTPMFLRNIYGAGYNVSITVKSGKVPNIHTLSKELVTEISSILPGTKVSNVEIDKSRIILSLPNGEKHNYDKLFKTFENKELKCLKDIEVDISVRNTTMEEIFLRAGYSGKEEEILLPATCETVPEYKIVKRGHLYKGWKLIEKKRWVIFKKKILKHCLLQLLIAICLVSLTLYLGTVSGIESSDHHHSLKLSLATYKDSIVTYSVNENKINYPDEQMQNLVKTFENLVTQEGVKLAKAESVSNNVIQRGIENILNYKQHLVVGAEFNRTDEGDLIANAMYSNAALHGAPISLNLIMNTILKSEMGDSYSIALNNKPLPSINTNIQREQSTFKTALLWVFLFPLAPLLIVSTFIYFPQVDNSSFVRYLMYMSGLSPFIYWFSIFLFDLFVYLIQVFILLIVVGLFNFSTTNIFGGLNEIFAIFMLCLVYGIWTIFVSYLFSYMKSVSSAIGTFIMSGFMSGIFLTLIVVAMLESQDEFWVDIGNTLKILFSVLPQFNFSHACVKFCTQAVWNFNWLIMSTERKQTKCISDPNPCCGKHDEKCAKYQSYFSGPNGIRQELLIMFFMAVFTYILICLWDKFHRKIFSRHCQGNTSFDENDGDDETVAVKNVKMSYGKRLLRNRKLVLDNLNLNIKQGHCFGLLGPNGAGKSTAFRIFAAEEFPTEGWIKLHLMNKWITSDDDRYQENVGYCPQFDAVDEDMTGREMLELFACLRGVNELRNKEEMDKFMEKIGLLEFADVLVKEYSGGNKRKLNFGISILGVPKLILLDEPTSGVDPISRRKLWKMIRDAKCNIASGNKRSSLLLTSHSMDECEVLCDELAILKHGKIEVSGTIPSIKQNYEKGFTLNIKVKPLPQITEEVDETDSTQHMLQTINPVDTIRSMLKSQAILENVKIIDEHQNIVCCRMDEPSKKRWSEIFHFMENLKREREDIIEDYDISNTTLEEVFLAIARDQ